MKLCSVCKKPLGPKNRTGLCNPDFNRQRAADPVHRAKLSVAMKSRLAHDPVLKEEFRARALALRDLPQTKAAKRARWMAEKPWIKGNECRPAGSEARRRAGVRQSSTLLADIPPHLRSEYRRLTVSKLIPAAEARAMIAEQHELEMARWRRAIGAEPKPLPLPPPGCDAIDGVATMMGFARDDIFGPSRSYPLVDARALIAVLLRAKGMTFAAIGAAMHRDHTSIVHLVQTFGKRAARNPKIAAVIAQLSMQEAA